MAETFEEIKTSINDKRIYRHITLPNKFEALLIHDPDAEKSAAACDVKVGSMSDPKDVPGLAHFLEHMLFLGTEKYPEEGGYHAFINAHGGMNNAYTASEDTVYYYDILSDSFEKSLDMFASFFTCPLFSEGASEREMIAVDNENTKNLQSDLWRNFQLMKHMAKPSHPFRIFNVGNLETLKNGPEGLGISVRESLLNFYSKHYSANVMKLCVYGRESLDVLQSWVEEKFSSIPNKDLSIPSFPELPYGPEELGRILEVTPVRDSKGVDLSFLIPSVQEHYRVKPLSYLAHLIGHEGPGSILSLLKKRGWANGLYATCGESMKDWASFDMGVDLTDTGVEAVEEVIAVIFEYIGMLRREGPKEWIADEVKSVKQMEFRFLQKSEASEYVVKLVNNMHKYPKEGVISGDFLLEDVQGTLALSESLMSYLTPSNAIIKVKSRGFKGKTQHLEPWYGTEYNVRSISAELMGRLDAALTGSNTSLNAAELTLPEANPFLPTEFELRTDGESDPAAPVLIENIAITHIVESFVEPTVDSSPMPVPETVTEGEDEAEADAQGEGPVEGEATVEEPEEEEVQAVKALPGRVRMTWFRPDGKWRVPKINVIIKLETGHAYSTPLNVALAEMYAKVLKERLNEYAYYADCAGIHYEVQNTRTGLELSFYGYHHKLPVLVAKTLQEMSALSQGTCEEDLFLRMKQKTLRAYYNLLFSQPYYHCILGSLNCLEEPRWTATEKHAALSAATLDDMKSFSSVLLRQLRSEVLVHGNASQQEAQSISLLVEQWVKSAALPYSLEPVKRVVSVRPGVQYVYRQTATDCNPKELNSAIENLYLVCREDGLTRAGEDDDEDLEECPWSLLGTSALLELISHLITAPMFEQLRTKDQLGYIVHNASSKVGNVLCLRVIVQSNSCDPVGLDQHIETFLSSYKELLSAMPEETLRSNAQAVIDTLLEKPKNLDEETGRIWSEIQNSTYLFNRKQLQADFLRTVTVEDAVKFFDVYIISNPLRRKFSSQFFGAGKHLPVGKQGGVVLVRDPAIFKTSLPLSAARNFVDNVDVQDDN